ncbi:hypothetical protein F5144DRAFT_599947 [Chaetomium tenue]|uniref:Uncharacterized protein n=1 Tax=Chaetomium tenue TaxID=1854479 RepID=A0ACB7PLQ5_9PEZI|nr:hypothetical protein F5144DRAFT_599947 [Chaetomium globosum]
MTSPQSPSPQSPTPSSPSPPPGPPPLLPPPPAPCPWTLATLPHLERASLLVSQTHLVRALDHVGARLDAAGIPWALMGGLALLLHGYRNRTTRDVDVAVGEGVRAREVVGGLGGGGVGGGGGGGGGVVGVYTPPLLSVAGSGCGRFYVLLEGEGEGDGGEGVGGERVVVEVDVVLAGHLGAPRSLVGATTTKTAQTAAGMRSYSVLSVQHLCRAKLHALYQREAERDFGDLEWLCMNFTGEVTEAADTFDEDERNNFVAKYLERHSGSQELMIKELMAMMRLGPEGEME